LWLQLGVIVLALHTAYLGILPRAWLSWPFADKTLHALLIGGAGFWLNLWLSGRAWRVGRLALPVGIGLTFGIALGEEFLQLLSPNRTFDLLDLTFDVIGLAIAWLLSQRLLNARSISARASRTPGSISTSGKS
jgi:polysaccharide biosynthesis protein VpsQ